jgi:hypothetical protein
MKDNNVNGINRLVLLKHMYFSPCINLNDIVDNATIRIQKKMPFDEQEEKSQVQPFAFHSVKIAAYFFE